MNRTAFLRIPKRTVLYYPTISVRTGRWLRRALLYWDEIASIVPRQVDSKDRQATSHLSADIQYLRDRDIFRPIYPSRFFDDREAAQSLIDEFKTIATSDHFERSHVKPRSSKVPERLFMIHDEKTTHEITNFLIAQDLAAPRQGSEWWGIEERTALLYMSLLAKHLAENDPRGATTPGSDRTVYERWAFSPPSTPPNELCLAVRFSNMLPVPSGNTPLEHILEYKERRQRELLEFRRYCDVFQAELSQVKSRSEANHVLNRFGEDMLLQLEDLRTSLARHLRGVGAQVIMESMKVLLGGMVGAQSGDALSLTTDRSPPRFSTQSSSLAEGAIEVVAQGVRERDLQRARRTTSPLAYLYYAEQERILGRIRRSP